MPDQTTERQQQQHLQRLEWPGPVGRRRLRCRLLYLLRLTQAGSVRPVHHQAVRLHRRRYDHPNASVASYFELTTGSTVGAARTFAAPTSAPGYQFQTQEITISIFNNTGGAITTTWNANYLLAGAWVDPAAGKRRLVTFLYNGVNWIEKTRSAADI